MPSLTVQYMSDSGTIELSRDCGEEGTRRMPCRGRADREAILNELNCIDGSSSTTVTESTVTSTTTKSRTISTTAEIPASTVVNKEILHFQDKTFNLQKSLSMENAEDNNIDNNISQIETPAERHRPAKISIEDFMMGDQPSIQIQGHNLDRDMVAKKIIREMPKKVQAKDKWLKKQYTKVLKSKKHNEEEIMLGDQPIIDEMQPLPHMKKSLAIDLKHHVEPTNPSRSTEATIQLEAVTITTSTTVTPISSSTAETRLRRETEISPDDQNVTGLSNNIPTTETPLNTVNVHPPKMSNSLQKPHHAHNDGITAITSHDVKEKLDVHGSSDHFIPPMLLVRTKFTTSSRSHSESPIQEEITSITTPKIEPHSEDTSTVANHIPTSVPISSTSETSATTLLATSTESSPTLTTINAPTEVSPHSTTTETLFTVQEDATNVLNSSITTTTTTESINLPLSTATTPHSIEHHTVETVETAHTVVVDLPKFRQPHAPQRTAELHIRPSSNNESNTVITELPSIMPTNGTSPYAIDNSEIVTTLDTTSSSNFQHTDETTMSSSHVTENVSNLSTSSYPSKDSTTTLGNDGTFSSTEDDDNVSDFTNANNFQPYRPNRRRTLTKPETHNYMKKILG